MTSLVCLTRESIFFSFPVFSFVLSVFFILTVHLGPPQFFVVIVFTRNKHTRHRKGNGSFYLSPLSYPLILFQWDTSNSLFFNSLSIDTHEKLPDHSRENRVTSEKEVTYTLHWGKIGKEEKWDHHQESKSLIISFENGEEWLSISLQWQKLSLPHWMDR